MSRSALVNTTFWFVQLPVSDSEQFSARSANSLTLSIRLRKLIVVPHDGGRLGHHVAQLLMNQIRILAPPAALEHRIVLRLLAVPHAAEQAGILLVACRILLPSQQVLDPRRDDQAAEDAAQQRIGPQPIRAVILIVALADGVQAGNVRLLIARRAGSQAALGRALVVDPQAAHRVVDGRENLHRHVARIDALELLVDLRMPPSLRSSSARGMCVRSR